MKDPEIEALVDLVRGLLNPVERRELEARLASSKTGRQRRELLRQVVEFASGEPERQVPPELVAKAKAIFPPAAAAKPVGWKKLAAALVFDSLAQPLPAGVRVLGTGERHAVYRAGEFEIHLQWEPAASGQVACIGQITAAGPSRETLAGLPIEVRSGRKLLVEAKANSFGEFEVQYRASPSPTLVIPLPLMRRRIAIPLGGLEEHSRKK